MLATIVDQKTKIKKQQHWLKYPKEVPQKMNFVPKYKYSNPHIWNSFFNI